MRFAALIVLFAGAALAQTNQPVAFSNAPGAAVQTGTNAAPPSATALAAAQAASIQGRRHVCGKILKMLPEGVVVDSGYTNLMSYPSWLIPQTATATRPANLLEENSPEGLCVGLVLVTDLPKTGARPKVYDYINVTAYPAGQFTYNSVGDLQRTVRKFSVQIEKAVAWRLAESGKQGAPAK